MLEARLEAIHSYGSSMNGVVPVHHINEAKIKELAKDGWLLVTVITPRPSPEVLVGVFYRKVSAPEKTVDAPAKTDTAKKPGRPRKTDA